MSKVYVTQSAYSENKFSANKVADWDELINNILLKFKDIKKENIIYVTTVEDRYASHQSLNNKLRKKIVETLKDFDFDNDYIFHRGDLMIIAEVNIALFIHSLAKEKTDKAINRIIPINKNEFKTQQTVIKDLIPNYNH